MEPVTLALTLAAKYAPDVVKYLTKSDTALSVANTVLDIASDVTMARTKGKPLSTEMTHEEAENFKDSLAVFDSHLQDLAYADVKDARARDVAIQAGGQRNYRADFLALLAVTSLIICVYFIAVDPDLPERAVNAIMFVAGVMAAAVRDVYGFEFGSSRSSKEKDATISNLSK